MSSGGIGIVPPVMDANPIVLDDAAGDVVVVVVEGEHDIYTAPTLRERLDEALGRGGGVVVDLTAATFVDSSILGALLDAAAREARVPVGFMAAITRGLSGSELTEMAELRGLGAAGFTDDGRPVADAGVFRRALQYQRLCGGVLALHEEDPALSGTGAMHEGIVSALLGVAGIPSVSESTMIARDCELAGYEGARIHIQHLSARESVAVVAAAKRQGVAVTCEASPHHLTMTDEDVRSLDPRRKMNPPLRAEADRQALVDGLRDGTIDCIATDHAPHARDEKEVPFEQAPMGTTGLETAFSAVYTDLVVPGTLTLELVVEKLTAGLGLLDLLVPVIAAGEPANLVLVDLDAEWVVGESGYESRSENCCFAGRTLSGRVLLTVAAGAVAYRERSTRLSEVGRVTSSEGQSLR